MDDRDQKQLEKKLERAKKIRHILDKQIPVAEQNVKDAGYVDLRMEAGVLCIGNLGFSMNIDERDAALAVSLVVIEKLKQYRERLEAEYRNL